MCVEMELDWIENPNLVEIYADRAGSVEVNGGIARVTFCVRRRIAGRSALMPVLTLIGPVDAIARGRVREMALAAERKAAIEEDALIQ